MSTPIPLDLALEVAVWKQAFENEHKILKANYAQGVRVTEAIMAAIKILQHREANARESAALALLEDALAP